ncbi:hypothetical protein J6590_003939 [Homalodisca vitripennis]|nr:hypothetical protein J6590_003939 [Homalodisca vitripennis]
MTDAEMYSKVAQLFEDHDDLLAEFVHFLPDATDLQKPLARHFEELSLLNLKRAKNVKMRSTSPAKMGLKRSPSITLDHNSSTCQRTTPYAKKQKRSTTFRDISL